MFTVGLTGGICSGKSEVAGVLAACGCRLLDADRIARSLMAPGTGLFLAVTGLFGPGIIGADGAIDRAALGRLVFSDFAKREQLNALVHPQVVAEEDRLLREAETAAGGGPSIAVVEAALMVEAGTWSRYHRLVVVHCTVAQQVARLTEQRGFSREAAEARVGSQLPVADKLALAHYTVDGSGSLARTREQAKALYQQLVRDERQHREEG